MLTQVIYGRNSESVDQGPDIDFINFESLMTEPFLGVPNVKVSPATVPAIRRTMLGRSLASKHSTELKTAGEQMRLTAAVAWAPIYLVSATKSW